MPSNRELIERAEGLGVELGVAVQTKGLNNAKLLTLVEELEANAAAKNPEDERGGSVEAPGAASDGTEPQPNPEPSIEASPSVESGQTTTEHDGVIGAASEVVPSFGGAVRRTAATSPEPGNEANLEVGEQPESPSRSPTPTVQQTEPNAVPPAPSRSHKPRHPYAVANGRSLVVARGVLGPGSEVRLDDVAGGRTQLDELVASGYLVRNESEPAGAVGMAPARVNA